MPALEVPPGFQGTFRTDLRARAAYAEGAGIYRIVPEAVALPTQVDDLVALVTWAACNGRRLTPRGAGSAVSGASVGRDVIVDTSRLGGAALRIDAGRRRGVTAASATWGALADAAGRHGLRLPPDPSSGDFATLGGMVATNAAGARSLHYGPMRPWVSALDIVTADGEVTRWARGAPPPPSAAVKRFERDVAPRIREAGSRIRDAFPRTSKNTSGFALNAYLESGDLLDLLIGSEGTLAIVTAVEWRLDPVPAHVAGLLVQLRDLANLTEVVRALRTYRAVAIELLDRSFLDALPPEERPGGEVVLIVEFEGDDAASLRGRVGDAVRALDDQVEDVRTALGAEALADLWSLRHAASPTLARLPDSQRSLQVIEDGCVPLDRLADYLAVVRASAERAGVPFVIFGHAGDGHLHVNLLPDVSKPGWEAPLEELLFEVTEAVIRFGGTPAGEHGDGRLRAGLVERVYGREIVDLFRAVKQAFDPDGILNPGVILPEDWRPLGDLKAGGDATAIPGDVAAALRDVERHAGYATPRLELVED